MFQVWWRLDFFMQKEINQFKRNFIWDLVMHPQNKTIIGTGWVFRNKLNENDMITRNKARLVAKWYIQAKGGDYHETYTQVAHLKVIRLVLAFPWCLYFNLNQMDVKFFFLNVFIKKRSMSRKHPITRTLKIHTMF